jgi:hypothetical protein
MEVSDDMLCKSPNLLLPDIPDPSSADTPSYINLFSISNPLLPPFISFNTRALGQRPIPYG